MADATISSYTLAAVLLTQLVVLANAAPVQLPHWLTSNLPHKGSTIDDEIKCYTLPYGTIGFISHGLTYWTVACLYFHRRPFAPWTKITAGKFDLALAILQIVVTIAVSVFTMIRCRNRWQFVLVAVWKSMMSLVVGMWGIHASASVMKAQRNAKLAEQDGALAARLMKKASDLVSKLAKAASQENPSPEKSSGRQFWLWFYCVAMIIGFTGLVSLVKESWYSVPKVQLVTKIFGGLCGGLVGALILLVVAALFSDDDTAKDQPSKPAGRPLRHIRVFGEALGFGLGFGLVWGGFLIVVLGAFYSDWVLGLLANNLIGVPSQDNSVLYWAYFGAKRLPTLFV